MGAHSVAYIPRLTLQGCCIQTYATDLYDPDREGFVVNNAPSNIISDDLIEKIRQSPNVKDASPYLMFRIRSSAGTGEWLLGGIDLTKPNAYRSTVVAESQVVEGEFIKPDAMDKIMAEQEFASANNLSVGSDLQIGNKIYQVAAIVNPPLRPGKANIYMSLPGLRELVKSRLTEHADNPANAVLIESKGAKYHDKAKADIAMILGQSSRISSYGCYQPGMTAMGINENTALTITVLVVLCMLLLAMRIQYSSVIQRQFDIGVLKAIGWRNRNVVSQILAEAFFCAFAGALSGVLLALIILSFLPDELMAGKGALSNPWILIAGLFLPLAGGLLSGFLSSLRAVQIQTSDILRSV
jgi:putative ABC transport system permease protein